MIFHASSEDAGVRLDRFLSSKSPDISRTRLQRYIKEGRVLVNGTRVAVPRTRISEGDEVAVNVPAPRPLSLEPQAITLDIVFEDQDIIVVNKPAGMVVHPGAGHESGTLVHALLHHCSDLEGIGDALRPGIVHRLDMDTSGLIIIAKNSMAHHSLISQFAERTTSKRYVAIVAGYLRDKSGTIDAPVGRHPVHRKKMAANVRNGREAVTHWKVLKELKGASIIEARIVTGRTHQIRVHMASIGHPLLGDSLYGGPAIVKLQGKSVNVARQMLHAAYLRVRHPGTGETVEWEVPLPPDMQAVLAKLL